MTGEKSLNGWPLARVIEELAPADLVQRLREAETQVDAAKAIAARSAAGNCITGSMSVLYEQEDDRDRVAGAIEHRDQLLARIVAPFRTKLAGEEWESDARVNDPEADRSPILASAWPYIKITDWANSKGVRSQGQGRTYFDIRISMAKAEIATEGPYALTARARSFENYLIGEKEAGRRQTRTAFERISREEFDLPLYVFNPIWAEHGWTKPGRIKTKTSPENPL